VLNLVREQLKTGRIDENLYLELHIGGFFSIYLNLPAAL
jgi:hypothetical protein